MQKHTFQQKKCHVFVAMQYEGKVQVIVYLLVTGQAVSHTADLGRPNRYICLVLIRTLGHVGVAHSNIPFFSRKVDTGAGSGEGQGTFCSLVCCHSCVHADDAIDLYLHQEDLAGTVRSWRQLLQLLKLLLLILQMFLLLSLDPMPGRRCRLLWLLL